MSIDTFEKGLAALAFSSRTRRTLPAAEGSITVLGAAALLGLFAESLPAPAIPLEPGDPQVWRLVPGVQGVAPLSIANLLARTIDGYDPDGAIDIAAMAEAASPFAEVSGPAGAGFTGVRSADPYSIHNMTDRSIDEFDADEGVEIADLVQVDDPWTEV